MVKYEVTVTTSKRAQAPTTNNVFIKLVGTDGESKRTWLTGIRGSATFYLGAESKFTVSCPTSLGKLVLIELDKRPLPLFPEDAWFPSKIEIKSPEKDTYVFPIYRWISGCEVHLFREGTALRIFDDNHHLGKYCREKELKLREEQYSWYVYKEGLPHCMKADSPASLPCEVQFSFTRATEFALTASSGIAELKLKWLSSNKDNWSSVDAIRKVFCNKTTQISALPENFTVTDEMVFLRGGGCLSEEMQKGNLFLCDFKQLDGVKTNVINGKKQYLMAPLVLLHKTPDDKLMPIAIQLKQTPGDDNPIFFPTDSEYDWLLAKAFVKSADFNEHQLNAHLLRTHLLAEVFAVSLLRNVPMVHPLYKLLIPHTRYTLQINFLARKALISESGVFSQFAASGGEGMITILKRSMSSMTYTSLCLPDDIHDRGMDFVPNYYYRDDGLRLWDIIHRFVRGVICHYYKTDEDVCKDAELQKWIQDIFEHGFLSNTCSGIPQSFSSLDELIKFVVMVICNCSGQHSAVNSGQYDYGGWMPNTPISLQRAPPTTKGTTSETTMLQTFPDVNTTVQGMSTMWLLSKQSSDFVALGQYPEDHFCEAIPCKLIRDFQGELEILSTVIKTRNKSLEVPYTYMDPALLENSVAI